MSNSFRFTSQTIPLAELDVEWLIVLVPQEPNRDTPLAELDLKLDGELTRLRQSGDLTGKSLETITLYSPRNLRAQRLLLVGLGDKPGRNAVHDAAAVALRQISTRTTLKIAIAVPDEFAPLTPALIVQAIVTGAGQGCTGPGVRKSEPARTIPQEIILAFRPGTQSPQSLAAIRRGMIEADAVAFAKELVNLPPCDLYPETFAARAGTSGNKVQCEIWDEERLIAERMGCILAVAKGSTRPPRMAILRYMNGGTSPTLAFVGKGVTFDSGGLSLKTNDQMLDMKGDMAGGATVLAAVRAIAALEVPINLVGYIPIVENMPGGNAVKLGDVIVARNGKTIEVLNTDAEGRLILADALAYAAEGKPGGIVDLATLTGAVMIALGTQIAGLMSNHDGFASKVASSIGAAGERSWRLPLDADFEDGIRSKVADIKNVGSNRYGGAIVGGIFLQQFVNGVPWVHLDIAGPAWADHDSPTRDAGGTGAYVRSLIELAYQHAAST